MDFLVSSAHAQAAAPAAPAGAAPGGMFNLAFMAIMFVIFYFMLIRPQMKRAKEQRAMIAALAKGDEVVTSGGLLGRIEDITEQFITLELAPGLSVKLQKHAISAVLPKGTLKSA